MNETELMHALQGCSLHSLLLLTSKALTRSGFGDVEILDRRLPKQKSRHGGHELLCETYLGSRVVRVAVKVVNDSLRVRMLDELAGVTGRTAADVGVIVTPHAASEAIIRKSSGYRNASLEVIDGPSLARLLIKHRIGVRGKDGVDYAFFAALEDAADRMARFISKNGRP